MSWGRVIVILFVGIMNGCADEAKPAPDPSPWITDLKFETLAERVPIGEKFSWPQGDGVYAAIEFTPAATPPKSLGGRDVREPSYWPMAVALFEPGSNWQDSRAVWLGGNIYRRERETDPPPGFGAETNAYVGKNAKYAALPAFDGAPKFPADLKPEPGVIYRWTFLGAEELQGDYEYELLVFPTSRGHFLTPDLGEPVVLQRGKFHVTPSDAAE